MPKGHDETRIPREGRVARRAFPPRKKGRDGFGDDPGRKPKQPFAAVVEFAPLPLPAIAAGAIRRAEIAVDDVSRVFLHNFRYAR